MSSTAGGCEQGHAGEITAKEAAAGILPSHGISLDIPGDPGTDRAPIIRHLSTPAYQSPIRHHRRQASHHRQVKETLNARSEYTNSAEDGKGEHHINQYIIKDEIGRGSFGAVHLAVDQYGKEYAAKEFSKSRLRQRAQSNILRRPHGGPRRPGHLAAGLGLNAPLHRHPASDIQTGEEKGNPLYLIKEEIAIMKKLDHPNLVSLIEVLDDPEEDSLYMILEMCKKGVVMKVGLGEKADPYDAESCRCWFRDLVLGIEYLHAQGVVHRDIKPDNLLLTEDDVLKIVDFGVSEMFEKSSEMRTAKSAGSPAFLPPELCVSKHGDVSGKAADIWSMGVSLYCLRFGKIPFERSGVLELYEAIKNDRVEIEPDCDPRFCDLIRKLLEKDPTRRITIEEIREHPWVTNDGSDPLLSKEENTADLIEPPSETEVNHAITTKMRNLLTMMKAVKKFKGLLDHNRRPAGLTATLGPAYRSLHQSSASGVPIFDGRSDLPLERSKSADIHDRHTVNQALVAEGIHATTNPPNLNAATQDQTGPYSAPKKIHTDPLPMPSVPVEDSGEKGHAHDPLDEEPLFLGIGNGAEEMLDAPPQEVVAESPSAAEFNVYDTAYQEEVDRIRAAQGHEAMVYLTRRVDDKKKYRDDPNMLNAPSASQARGVHSRFKDLVDSAREKGDVSTVIEKMQATGDTFSDITSKALADSKAVRKDVSDRGGSALNDLLGKAAGRMKPGKE